jgi:LmbE family N-acetylglucosaminyl deacetylase
VHTSRRRLLAAAVAVPLFANVDPPEKRLKILVSGGHPGDPECGCAGTIARFTALGHDVALLYLNRGEGYCKGNDPSQCGSIRTAEAQRACHILRARAVFASQIDGRAIVDNAHYLEFQHLLESENPDILFTQWPIDKHRDHRALSQLALDAWLNTGKKSAFYYYEVADDTMMFSPGEFVDISSPEIEAVRHAACYAHASQQPEKWYPQQVELTRFRGSQSGHSQAEGFLRHWESRAVALFPSGQK